MEVEQQALYRRWLEVAIQLGTILAGLALLALPLLRGVLQFWGRR